MNYDHSKIEKKWQNRWEQDGLYVAQNNDPRPKFYALIEFPYPSGEGLHVGHPRSYTAMDIIAQKRRMEGYNVLYPIGFDSFGLPTENYAIKTGRPPAEITKENIANFTRQLKRLGFSFDWSRSVTTSDPSYYRWTQWIFLQFFQHGLAYKKKMPINWCPSCKIGLANEEVVNNGCERCGSPVQEREREQWMLAITKYADKLLEGLKDVNYIERAKVQQENWIGRSEGAEIEFRIRNHELGIKVFTTRPDTLFGVTYLVLAPEHPMISNFKSQITNAKEVDAYIANARGKSELERTAIEKEKTGVELAGIMAVNPATKQEISIWVADYVIARYGTGAIMAVPAHDVRDFAFAKKYELPIRQVIAPEFGIRRENEERRDGGCGIVFDPVAQKYAVYQRSNGTIGFFAGGVEDGEDEATGILREVTEESGLYDFGYTEKIASAYSHYRNSMKQVNRYSFASCYLIILKSATLQPTQRASHEDFALVWLSVPDILEKFKERNGEHDVDHWIWFLHQAVGRAITLGYDTTSNDTQFITTAYTGEGTMINSGIFDGQTSADAGWKIVDAVRGKKTVQYKLRDWVFSRQRYWGEPIPLVYCEHCVTWVPLPEDQLPLELPKVEKYQPTDTGESPLAAMHDWVKTTCPKCKGPARRETDTMPNWAGSSWYFLRYCDPENTKDFASKKALQYWTPVDWYNGGMEHTVLHLLYSRFWNQFLYDIGVVPTREPYAKRTSHGLIMAEDGEKMSKSRGNVVNPDAVVEQLGADTLRLYEMFMGPFDQSVPWSTDGIMGVRRFVEKVWRLFERSGVSGQGSDVLDRLLHKTIKKVTEDIEAMKFNTAISAMMIFVNAAVTAGQLSTVNGQMFLKILAPFTPHLAEELWERLGHKESIFKESWPVYDSALAQDEEVELVIQVNGKVRDRFTVPAGIEEAEARSRALASAKIQPLVAGKKVERVVVVKGRLVNIVVI